MKKKRIKILAVRIVCCVLLLGVVSVQVSWADVIRVKGRGVAPMRAKGRLQARLLARRAAVVDAYRNLGLRLQREWSSVPQYESYINETMFLRGAKIIRTDYLSGGRVEVEAELEVK